MHSSHSQAAQAERKGLLNSAAAGQTGADDGFGDAVLFADADLLTEHQIQELVETQMALHEELREQERRAGKKNAAHATAMGDLAGDW